MLPEVAGALVSGGLNLIGDIASETTARNAYKHRYQDEVRDLRAAGLNPALAYGANPGNPNTASFSGIGSEAVSGYQAAQQAQQAKANTELTKAQTDLLRKQTAALAVQPQLRNVLLSKDSDLRHEQAGLVNTQNSAQTIARDRAMATYDSDIAARKAQNKMPALLLPEARALAKWFRQHPDLGGWLNSAGGLTKLLNLIPAIPAE